MLKPSVGLIVLMSSPFSRLTTVVLPALSRPLRRRRQALLRGQGDARRTYTMRIRISLSFAFAFFNTVSRPMLRGVGDER